MTLLFNVQTEIRFEYTTIQFLCGSLWRIVINHNIKSPFLRQIYYPRIRKDWDNNTGRNWSHHKAPGLSNNFPPIFSYIIAQRIQILSYNPWLSCQNIINSAILNSISPQSNIRSCKFYSYMWKTWLLFGFPFCT